MLYAAAASFEEASSLLVGANGPAYVLAGGTDLLVRLRSGLVEPEVVVDIKRIPGVRDIVEEDGGWRLGAAVTGAEIGEHPGLRTSWPGVVEAVNLIGSTQVQGRATPVGNLCNASPAADSVPALIAAQATVRIFGPNGLRDAPVERIPAGPGRTTLMKGEVVASLFIPAPEPGSGDAYARFTPRTEMDIAVVAAGVKIVRDRTARCTDIRVCLGAVAPTPILVAEAAELLRGSALDAARLEHLGRICSAASRPIDDKRGSAAFRREVIGVIARRAAEVAWRRAGEAVDA